jgi:hypothetical protein
MDKEKRSEVSLPLGPTQSMYLQFLHGCTSRRHGRLQLHGFAAEHDRKSDVEFAISRAQQLTIVSIYDHIADSPCSFDNLNPVRNRRSMRAIPISRQHRGPQLHGLAADDARLHQSGDAGQPVHGEPERAHLGAIQTQRFVHFVNWRLY